MKTKIFLSTMAIVLLFVFAGTFNPETAAKAGACPLLYVTVTNGNGVISQVTITPLSGGGFEQKKPTDGNGVVEFSMCGEPNNVNYQIFAVNPVPPNDSKSGSKTYYFPGGNYLYTDITLTVFYGPNHH